MQQSMKLIKYIALSAFVTLGVFFTVIYSSCTKNECGAVLCQNDGTCMGGICKCVRGTDGVNCQNVYRKNYAGVYVGIPPDDPISDTTNMLIMIQTDDTTNYNLMEVIWVDTSGTTRLQLPLELHHNAPGGSNFDITPTVKGITTYTGGGSINGKQVSMNIRQEDTSGAVKMTYFNNYIRQ